MERGSEHAERTDEQLLSDLAEGRPDAVGVLWDRHARPLYSLAFRVLGDAGWAEEVVQDVFVRLWADPGAYNPSRGELRRWLLTVTHHASVDGLRGRRGTARMRDAGSAPLPFLAGEGEDPAESAWNKLRAEEVRAALAELPPAQRQVMEWTYYDGWTQSQIAQRTGQPLGTVKTRLRLGARRLRVLLEGTGIRE